MHTFMPIIEIRKFAEDAYAYMTRQSSESPAQGIMPRDLGFMHGREAYFNPWTMPDRTTPISTLEAIEVYGEEKVAEFCQKVAFWAAPVPLDYVKAHPEEERIFFCNFEEPKILFDIPEDREKMYFL